MLDRVQLTFRAYFVAEERGAISPEDPRSFWDPLIDLELSRYSPEARVRRRSIPELEAKLKLALPRAFRQVLVSYFLPQPSRVGERSAFEPIPGWSGSRARELVPLVGIDVASIRYGSLDLAIEFAGIKHLVELFDGNCDVFMMFAKTYLPEAFESALHELNFMNTPLAYNITLSPELVSAFTQPAGPGAPPVAVTGQSAGDRARAIWQITNFTLLVPVALSLLVLYVTMKSVSEDKVELQNWQKSLAAREQAFARSVQDRLVQVEKTQGELVTLLRQTPGAAEAKK